MGASASEQELALAQRSGLYLVLDLAHGQLLVKARGVELDRAPVRGVELVLPRTHADAGSSAGLELPVVWRVAKAPEEEWRQVVAPATLVPYREEAEPPLAAVTPTPEPEPPAQYRVELDNGYILAMGASPPSSLLRRLLARLRSGWARMRGRSTEAGPPTIVIETSADDARRLLHVFRPGVAILVADP